MPGRGKNPVCGFLSWGSGGLKEQREIKDFLSVGREKSNQLVLDDPFVSRRHIRIERDKSRFILKDMNSRNGVYLNGARVCKAVLSDKDQIQIGKSAFGFSFERFNDRESLISRSFNKEWSRNLSRIPYIAKSGHPVLLLGPSGTGKELLARLIHSQSAVCSGPLVSVNCSALTESLIESELFGHRKGSYTGALSHRKGAFLAADGGSLFLDEIGDLPLSLQPKLLRAIEYHEIKPVGADEPLKVNARIIAATHQNLRSMTADGSFRKDLYYRLNVVSLTVPSLRRRMEDFEPLLKFFSAECGAVFSDKAIAVLKSREWPGNIRELKNTAARASVLFKGEIIDKEKALSLSAPPQAEEDLNFADPEEPRPGMDFKKGFERKILEGLMRRYKGNQLKIAKDLAVASSSLHDRLSKYRIEPKQFKRPPKRRRLPPGSAGA